MNESGRGLPDGILYGAATALLVLAYLVSRSDVGLILGSKLLFGGALLIGAIATVAYVAWYLWQEPTTPTALELSRRFEEVRFMDGSQFEALVADLFRAMGHRAVVCGGVGDQGVDIVVNPQGGRIAVQCKYYSRPVQEVYAGAPRPGWSPSQDTPEAPSTWPRAPASRSTMPKPYASG